MLRRQVPDPATEHGSAPLRCAQRLGLAVFDLSQLVLALMIIFRKALVKLLKSVLEVGAEVDELREC